MYHCSGRPGPNTFDALGALEQWVELGQAPEAIIATKYANDAKDQGAVRTMPLAREISTGRIVGRVPKMTIFFG